MASFKPPIENGGGWPYISQVQNRKRASQEPFSKTSKTSKTRHGCSGLSATNPLTAEGGALAFPFLALPLSQELHSPVRQM